MLCIIIFLHVIYAPQIYSVSVKIDGLIDLGPKWNFEYNYVPISHPRAVTGEKTSHKAKPSFDDGADEFLPPEGEALHFDSGYPLKKGGMGIYEKTHLVREDNRIKDFTVHIFKQGLKVFDNLKAKLKLKHSKDDKFNGVLRSYKEKFADFVNETQSQKIMTRLGTKKVILNTLETNNRLLRRLVDHFVTMTDERSLMRHDTHSLAHVLQEEVDKEIDLEYDHVCKKFGICRSKYSYTNFLSDMVSVVQKADERKLKQYTDAITEVLKNIDLKSVMDHNVKKKFIRAVENVETWPDNRLRPMISTVKNMILSKNQPIALVEGSDQRVVDRTVAILDMFDILDEKIAANETNKGQWDEIVISLSDWRDGHRDDILEIMDSFGKNLVKGADEMDSTAANAIMSKLKVILD